MDVESRDGWTFLRLVSTNNTWQWTNRVASPSYTNTIRAVCSFSQKKITENVFSPFFYLFSPPLQIWMRWRGILWCVWRVGFLFYFLYFFVRENGRRVFRFSTVHRIHIPLDWDGVWSSGLHGLDCISSTRMLDFVPFDVCEVRRDPSYFFLFIY